MKRLGRLSLVFVHTALIAEEFGSCFVQDFVNQVSSGDFKIPPSHHPTLPSVVHNKGILIL